MRTFAMIAALLLAGSAAPATAGENAAVTARVNAFVDEWHQDAALARPAYFDKIAPDGIYIGTDRTERWTREAFQAWAARAFARPSAWTLTPRERHVSCSADGTIIWFDEQLDSGMGLLRATGVVRAVDGRLEIVHYQLSIAVPNEVQPRVTEIIAGFEGGK
jgi:hypothetical protein